MGVGRGLVRHGSHGGGSGRDCYGRTRGAGQGRAGPSRAGGLRPPGPHTRALTQSTTRSRASSTFFSCLYLGWRSGRNVEMKNSNGECKLRALLPYPQEDNQVGLREVFVVVTHLRAGSG